MINDLHPIARPLQLLFWGILVCAIDFYVRIGTPTSGFRFDFINDVVGFGMITLALSRIAEALPPGHMRGRMRFAVLVAAVSIVSALHDHVLYPRPVLIQLLEIGLGLLQIVALCLFCSVMHDVCRQNNLPAMKSWSTSLKLVICGYVIPMLLLTAINLLPPLVLGFPAVVYPPLVLLVLIPIMVSVFIHLLVTIARTRKQLLKPLVPPTTVDELCSDPLVP